MPKLSLIGQAARATDILGKGFRGLQRWVRSRLPQPLLLCRCSRLLHEQTLLDSLLPPSTQPSCWQPSQNHSDYSTQASL